MFAIVISNDCCSAVNGFYSDFRYALQFSQVGKLDILKKWDRDLEIVYDKVIESTLRSEGRMFKVKVKKDSTFSKLFSSKDEEELTVQLRTPQDAKVSRSTFVVGTHSSLTAVCVATPAGGS